MPGRGDRQRRRLGRDAGNFERSMKLVDCWNDCQQPTDDYGMSARRHFAQIRGGTVPLSRKNDCAKPRGHWIRRSDSQNINSNVGIKRSECFITHLISWFRSPEKLIRMSNCWITYFDSWFTCPNSRIRCSDIRIAHSGRWMGSSGRSIACRGSLPKHSQTELSAQ